MGADVISALQHTDSLPDTHSRERTETPPVRTHSNHRADSLHAHSTSAATPRVRPAAPADTTAVTTADSVACAHTDSCALITNATAEATRKWFTEGPLHLRYGDATHPLFRNANDPAEVFGTASAVVPAQSYTAVAAHPLTANLIFQGTVLLFAAAYIVLLYRHLNDALTVFSRLTRTHNAADRGSDNQGVTGFTRFLNIAVIIGLLFVGIAAVKAAELFLPADFTQILPAALLPAVAAVAIAACLILALYQSALMHLTGMITLSRSFVMQLMSLKRIYFVLMGLVTTPALLLFALCPPGSGKVWFYVIVVQLIITTLLYLRESLNLFLSKKVSILHWFLYLCTVEIFPISLLWFAAAR